MIIAQDSIFKEIIRVDTLYNQKIDPAIQEQYLHILESTNSQLNSSYTPLVLSITVITALVGLGAIAAGYFIWRQGKDFKDRQNEILDELSSSKNEYLEITELIKVKNAEIEEIVKNIGQTLIKEGQFDQAQTTTIETTIREASEKVKKDWQYSTTLKYSVLCKNCKKRYPHEVSSDGSISTKEMAKKVFTSICPYCESHQINNQRPAN